MKQQVENEGRIRRALEEMIEGSDLFIVGVELKGHTGASKLTVHLDGDSGVGIDACSDVSKKLAAFLDEEDLIGGGYTLEVSSPGVDQPLRNIRQYKKNTGRTLRVVKKTGTTLTGVLREAHEHAILLQVPGAKKKQPEEVLVPYDEIESATVEVAFK